MARATKEETKVIEMENKIEKMTKFLADNKIECFDIQKLPHGGKRSAAADGSADG